MVEIRWYVTDLSNLCNTLFIGHEINKPTYSLYLLLNVVEVSPEGHVKGSSSMVGPLEPAFLEPDMCNGRKVTGNEVRAEESNSTALDLQSSG